MTKAFKGALYVAGYDLSPYCTSVKFPNVCESQESHGIDANSKAYTATVKGGADISVEAMFDDVALGSDAALSAIFALGKLVNYYPGQDAIGKRAMMCAAALETSHERSNSRGALVGVSATIKQSGNVREGWSVLPKTTSAIASNGAALNNLASSAYGAEVFWQVFDVSDCAKVTLDIEDSDNGTTGWASVDTFDVTVGLDPVAYARTIAAGTLKQYVRAKWVIGTPGSTPSVTLACAIYCKTVTD
jgi:hypothetical protein